MPRVRFPKVKGILLKVDLRVLEIRSIRNKFLFNTRGEVKTNPLIRPLTLFTRRRHLAKKAGLRLTKTRVKVDDNASRCFGERYEPKHCNDIVPPVKTNDNAIEDTEAYQFCQLRLTAR